MRRRLTAGLATVGLVAAASLAVTHDGGPLGSAMDEERFCDSLRSIEVGHALGGEDPGARVVAVSRLADLASRAPDEIRVALGIMRAKSEERGGLSSLAASDLEDPDVAGAAFRAVYRLQFEPAFVAAASRVEKYAVERCGMEPSGWFDLDLTYDFDPGAGADLDLGDFDMPEYQFDETTFERFQADPVEVRPYEFDRSDWDRYRLDPDS